MINSKKFIYVFLAAMLIGYQCLAQAPGTTADYYIVFVVVAAICTLILGFMLRGVLRLLDLKVSNLLVFFISAVICILCLFLLFS